MDIKGKYVTIREKINQRKAEERKKKAINFSDFKADMKRSPMIFVGLGGSAFFTSLMGLFIGLAPRIVENGDFVLFGGAQGIGYVVIGLTFGLIYAVTFPVVGEYGVYYWHRRASLRDEGNTTQAWIGYGMMGLAGGFTVITALAAATILASLLHTFQAFQAIPEWTQKWTVLIIPISLAMHSGANIWYDHVSAWAEERREMERSLQMVVNESENRIRQARVQAQENAAIAAADEYERAAREGAVKAGRDIGKRAWEHDRVSMGGDDDRDGTPNLVDPDYPGATASIATQTKVKSAPSMTREPVPAGGFGSNGSDPMKG